MHPKTTTLVALLLIAVPLTGAHVFNHEDRHEVCDVRDMTPHGHFIGDGHAHTHDPAEGDALHNHDPCKQVRMDYPGYEHNAPINEISPPNVELDPVDLIYSDGDPTNTEIYAGGEAYQFPVPEGSFKVRQNLAVTSDLQAAGMGFPGSGTYDDPYIVEGYLITGNMVFKDTSKCFVIRNNVIVDRSLPAPILPDPGNIIDLPSLTPYWQQVWDDAQALRQQYLDLQAVWDADKAVWDADKAVWDTDKAAWDTAKAEKDDTLAWFQSEQARWEQAYADFEDAYVATVLETESLADSFENYADQYIMDITQPARGHSPYIDYATGTVTDMDALEPAFEAYQQDLDDDLTGEDVEGWIVGNPPPETPPEGFWGDEEDWEDERVAYDAYRQNILEKVAYYWNTLQANAPDDAAYQQFLDDYAAFQIEYDQFVIDYDAFLADYGAFLADYSAFLADYDAFQAEFDQVWTETGEDIADAEEHFAKVEDWTYEYVGELGTTLFNTVDRLLQWLLDTLFGILDPDDPNNVANNNGQLVLDWNGQCVHAYNNVVNDLRVNQNNDRTGYATGGIFEDNRVYTIGQIRHYDGIFRENEVGNRAHLHSLVDPTVAAPAGRTVNNDGANQGWYRDNVFYGQIDLDFHGHHHSAGFFAPLSHYHGSNRNVAYMQSGGVCSATHHTPDHMKANGPHHDYPQDDDVEVLGEVVLEGDHDTSCLPHHDHGKRWTSVFFNDNIIIDPAGVGLRFEDRDHRADDEQANSENMRELKSPHFHKKWVQMEDNVVVGKIFIDVLNAQGTLLWSDDWSEVQSPAGAARTVEALAHPGAEIVDSHPYRNDAWLDVQRNTLLLTQPTGVLVSDAQYLTRFQLKDNAAFAFPAGPTTGLDPAGMLDWLRASGTTGADLVQADIASWGGTDRGVQTFASLHHLRDGFWVDHCGNTARGLEYGIVATDRIYMDEANPPPGEGILACGGSDWGSPVAGVVIDYTTPPAGKERFSGPLRDTTGETDDFYASELAYDEADRSLSADTWDAVPAAPPVAAPDPGVSVTVDAVPS